MYVKICGKLENLPDITVIECEKIRFRKDTSREDGKDVRILEITTVCQKVIQWCISGDEMQVYLLNDKGQTLERIW